MDTVQTVLYPGIGQRCGEQHGQYEYIAQLQVEREGCRCSGARTDFLQVPADPNYRYDALVAAQGL